MIHLLPFHQKLVGAVKTLSDSTGDKDGDEVVESVGCSKPKNERNLLLDAALNDFNLAKLKYCIIQH